MEKHKTKESRIWVTFQDGVYDVTDFVKNHPGGVDKIMLAAGGSVEPYWKLYRQHYNSTLPKELLEEMRIGTLHPDDVAKAVAAASKDTSDPYCNDPDISPLMMCHQRKPINAQPPATLLTDQWKTPADLFFIRNHHPVPIVPNPDEFRFVINIEGSAAASFSIHDLKTKFKKHSVVSTLQCGGNRRGQMNEVAVTNGSPWGISAISTAEWGGVLLRDVFEAAGLTNERAAWLCRSRGQNHAEGRRGPGDADQTGCNITLPLHVEFVGLDGLNASIPARKALSRWGDVLLAFEMNGEPIPATHGAPLRAVVPGHVGIRNVKWVTSVNVLHHEATGPWQRGLAYKGFGPSQRSLADIDVEKIPSVQEEPVQSMITLPKSGAKLSPGINTVQGFAYSGGGRGIVRVDVSGDNGKSWKTATLQQGSEQPLDRAWAWTFWECDVSVQKPTEIICKATDASYNTQPESVLGIWNLRGINNNAWHRVKVDIDDDDE